MNVQRIERAKKRFAKFKKAATENSKLLWTFKQDSWQYKLLATKSRKYNRILEKCFVVGSTTADPAVAAIENKRFSEHLKWLDELPTKKEYQDGRLAYKNGASIESCPYDKETESDKSKMWSYGHSWASLDQMHVDLGIEEEGYESR